jgi:hypothetical protein
MQHWLIFILIVTLLAWLFTTFHYKLREQFVGAIQQSQQSTYNLPKIMWSFWDSNELPEQIRLIHENRAKKLEQYGWKLYMLNSKTVNDYIDLSNLPPNFDKLIIQHKVDYYRLLLLKKYGGVWIDASIIINDPEAINKLYNKSVQKSSEFTGFTLEPGPGIRDRSKYIENWFIMVPVNSEIINKWLLEFTSAISGGFDNYISRAKQEGVHIVDRIYSYLTQHACMQTVLQKRLGRPANIILKDAEKDMFKIQTDCNWDLNCLLGKFKTNMVEIRKIPYIKLRGGDRAVDIKEYFAKEEFGNRVGYAA